MPRTRSPRAGSMQFWPRARARREYPRIRTWILGKDAKLMGFAGYKVGMTHVMFKDARKNAHTKNMDVSWPVTVVECPPLKVASIKFYKQNQEGLRAVSEIYAANFDKELGRRLVLPKTKSSKNPSEIDFDEIRLVVYTQPKLTGIGKKIPEVFEVGIGGAKPDMLAYAVEKLGKDISIDDFFSAGQLLDVHAVTTGRGFQGPVKRFGVSLRSHKSEKSVRNPASLGAWRGQGHMMYRVAHAGKMGYHTRIEYNKLVVKVSNNPSEINASGGYVSYGNVKNSYLLIKGSISGPQKRLIRFTTPRRSRKLVELPEIKFVSVASKQGN